MESSDTFLRRNVVDNYTKLHAFWDKILEGLEKVFGRTSGQFSGIFSHLAAFNFTHHYQISSINHVVPPF